MKPKYTDISSHQDVLEGILTSMEEEIGSEIFTLRVLSEREEEFIDLIVAFENKEIGNFRIEMGEVEGKLAARVYGNLL